MLKILKFIVFEEKEPIKTVDKPNYTVDDYENPPKRDIKKDPETGKPMYRRKKLPNGDLITIAIMKKTGKHGGHTQMTSVWKKKNKENLAD